MGCWNKTCAVSNLHIGGSDEVAIFLLAKRPVEADTDYCYISSYYDALALPFYGKYDDYGGAEDCSGPGLSHIIDYLKKEVVELEVGENQYHDLAVKREEMNVEKLFELENKGRLYIKDWMSQRGKFPGLEGRPLAIAMVHKKIFDHIIGNYTLTSYYYDEDSEFCKREVKFQDVVNDLPEYIDRLRKHNYLLGGLGNLFGYEERNLAGKYLKMDASFASDGYFLINTTELIINQVKVMNDEQLTELLIELLKGQWVSYFMSSTRKPWLKQVGEGSQNTDPHGYEVLIGAMRNVLDDERKLWEEENDIFGDPSLAEDMFLPPATKE